MKTAIYYPHIRVRDFEIVRAALFYWDRLEVINPFGVAFEAFEDDVQQEAAELVVAPYKPTEDEMEGAHEVIVSFAEGDLPDWLSFNARAPSYPIYPSKLLPKTWDYL